MLEDAYKRSGFYVIAGRVPALSPFLTHPRLDPLGLIQSYLLDEWKMRDGNKYIYTKDINIWRHVRRMDWDKDWVGCINEAWNEKVLK